MNIFIITWLVALVSVAILGQNSENCDHSPPQFKSTSDNIGECSYDEDSPISDFVHFYLIKRGYNDYQKLTENQMTEQVDKSLPSYIFIHGFKVKVGNNTDGWMRVTGKKVLELVDANVILVDYGTVSNCNYLFLATSWIYQLSKYIADDVVNKWNLPPNQIKIIGHSLGAHIAGLTGALLNGEAEEVVALDPAGPMFDKQIFGISQETLNSSSAQFVQVIHTKPTFLGTTKNFFRSSKESENISDFFANFALMEQPGCGLMDMSCSHARAYELYFASMFPENKFIGKSSLFAWNQEKRSRFGFFNDRKKGTFFFTTTACFGYAK